MRSRPLRPVAAALAAGVVAAPLATTVPGPAGAQTSTTTTTAPAVASSSTRARVEVGDNFYKPERLEVPVGTRVTWRNEGRILHNVVPVKGKAWGTRSLVTGKSYSYRFKKPGTYAYYCTFHGSPTSGQRGSVVVTAAGSSTTTTTTAR
jgi:plastocyanin